MKINWKLVKRITAHLAIVLSGMLMVFLAIDSVNSAMMFIDHRLTKRLMWLLCALSVFNGATLLVRPARRSKQHGGDRSTCKTNRRKTSATSASSRT